MPRGRRRSSPAVIFGTRKWSRRSRADARSILVVIVILGGVGLLGQLSSSPQGAEISRTFGDAGLALMGAGILIIGLWIVNRMLAVRGVRDAIGHAVTQHSDALMRQRAKLVTIDAYGSPQMERWYAELRHFLATQVAPQLGRRGRKIIREREREFVVSVSRRIAEEMKDRPAFASLRPNATGAEFEAYCADKLRSIGWDAHITKGARDQGVDVIATKNGVRVVLQCKLHNRPIGNKAVQEAIAGKNFERANYAAVVAGTAYTRDAEQLAQTNGVLLLHHSQLEQLDSMLGIAG